MCHMPSQRAINSSERLRKEGGDTNMFSVNFMALTLQCSLPPTPIEVGDSMGKSCRHATSMLTVRPGAQYLLFRTEEVRGATSWW